MSILLQYYSFCMHNARTDGYAIPPHLPLKKVSVGVYFLYDNTYFDPLICIWRYYWQFSQCCDLPNAYWSVMGWTIALHAVQQTAHVV